MAYKRQIAYFDLIEYGEKKGSGGFCKWEQKEGVHALEVSISVGLQNLNGPVNIFTKSGDKLGGILIKNGRASTVFFRKDAEGDWVWEFSEIRIPLNEDRELMAEFEVDATDRESVEPVAVAVENASAETEADIIEKTLAKSDGEEKEQALYFLGDLLAQTHELIHPFGTEAEYYRIKLEDISLLKEEYHILRKNQFLFHGYYNYKYLILGRKGADSQEYWLGVPGIYHEREKMAARMYGFEKFEGAKPRYGVGDLGYYLITVK